MKDRLLTFVLGLFFCVLFIVFTFIVKRDVLTGFDFDTTVRLQNNIPQRFDPILSSFSIVGKFEVMLIALCILLLLRRKVNGLIIFALFGFAHVVELVGKMFLDHPGPPFMFYRYRTHNIFFDNAYVTGESYPSGHSFRAVFLSILLLYLISKSTTFSLMTKLFFSSIVCSLVFLICIGKVTLGEHWTSDVVGGILLGLGFGFLSLSIL